MNTKDTDDYAGIDYGLGRANIDYATDLRYGVIRMREILQAWCDTSEADYGEPELSDYNCPNCGNNCCDDPISYSTPKAIAWGDSLECEECGESFDVELPDCCEPLGFYVDDEEYKLSSCFDGTEVMVLKSPYFTYGQFCSPCVPGAINLDHPVSAENTNNKGYCLGHDWFDSGKAPYDVYSVATGELVEPKE